MYDYETSINQKLDNTHTTAKHFNPKEVGIG